MGLIQAIWALMRDLFRGRSALMVENLALRQQLGVLQRSVKRPKLRRGEAPQSRVFAARPAAVGERFR